MYYGGNKINSQIVDRTFVKNPYKKECVNPIKEKGKLQKYMKDVNWKMILGYGGLVLFFVLTIVALHLIF